MIHARHLIREAVVARLRAAGTSAGLRVYEHPTDPRSNLPALVVEDINEQQQTATLPGGPGRLVERMLMLDITAELQQSTTYARDRDQLIADVEAQLMGAPIAGVRNVELAGYVQDTLPGERPIAIGKQRFVLTYLTAANNPAVAI